MNWMHKGVRRFNGRHGKDARIICHNYLVHLHCLSLKVIQNVCLVVQKLLSILVR